MGETDVVCRLHHLANKSYQQELGCDSSGWSRIADRRIDCLVALSSIFAKRVNLQRGIVNYERGWNPEIEPTIPEYEMALLQLLLRFSATAHKERHFREESLEKGTVLNSERREQAQKIFKSQFTEIAR
jgi:hypothetical protein